MHAGLAGMHNLELMNSIWPSLRNAMDKFRVKKEEKEFIELDKHNKSPNLVWET